MHALAASKMLNPDMTKNTFATPESESVICSIMRPGCFFVFLAYCLSTCVTAPRVFQLSVAQMVLRATASMLLSLARRWCFVAVL